MSSAVLVAAAVLAGAYFASQAGDGTTAAQEGASTPTATPGSGVVFRTPPPGAQRGSWTPVPRCPEPTPTPTPPPRDIAPTPTPTPIPGGPATSVDVAATPTPAATASPAPWPCVPYDERTPPPGDPDFPLPTQPPQLTAEERARIKAENPSSATPVDYERQWEVGGHTITIPAGAIFYTLLTGGRRFDIVERGESKVYIDLETGAIAGWDVSPHDEDEFRTLILQPLTNSD